MKKSKLAKDLENVPPVISHMANLKQKEKKGWTWWQTLLGFLFICVLVLFVYFTDPWLKESRKDKEQEKINCIENLIKDGWKNYEDIVNECTELLYEA